MKQAVFDTEKLVLGPDGLRDFFWPVARSEVLAVRDEFLGTLIPHLRSEAGGNPHARLLSLLIHLVGEVLTAYQAQALIRRSQAAGREPVFPAQATVSNALLSGRLPETARVLSLLRQGMAPDPLWKQAARSLRDRHRRDPLRQSMLPLVDIRRDVVAIASGDLIRRHAEAVGSVHHVPLWTWFSPLRDGGPVYAGPPPPVFLDRVIEVIRAAFSAGHEPLHDVTTRYLRWWMTETLILADRYLGRLLANPKRIPRRLWRGTGGLVWGRLLSFGCRELGGEVVGHDHAHGQGAWSSYSDTIIELPFCDRFMVHTPTQREMALRNLRPELCLPDDAPEIAVLPNPGGTLGAPASVSPAGAARPGERPVAMYVGTLYVDDFVPFTPLHSGPTLIDWEARLIGRLLDWGYEVLLKPHPESLSQAPKEMTQRQGVRVLTDRFEQVCREADLLLFAQANSSSFLAALATDRPIVLPNASLNSWQPEARTLAERRCAFVETRLGPDNRLDTDWNSLRAALAAAPGLRDQAFLNSFIAR